MKIVITEALKLKNELAKTIQILENYARRSVNVKIYEENTISAHNDLISSPIDQQNFQIVFETIKKALDISFELNNAIAAFNKTSGIEETVRDIKNIKLLQGLLKDKLNTGKTTSSQHFNGKENVTRILQPIVEASTMKEDIKTFSSMIREGELAILKANTAEIEVGFTYEDIDNLSI